MEVFLHASTQMLILFTIVALGALARKKGFMNDQFDTILSKLVMTIAVPGMILDSVLGNDNLPGSETILQVLLYSTVMYVGICVFAWIMVRFVYRGVPRAAKGAHAFLIAFGNTGFIGFAVIAGIMGDDAVLYAAIYNIPYNLAMFSVGILFIMYSGESTSTSRRGVKGVALIIGRQLVNPCMIACFVAMFLAIFGFTDSGYIGKTCEYIGQLTVPAAMLVTGSTLIKQPFKDMVSDGWSYVTTFCRLLAVPLLLFAIGSLFIQDSYILSIIVLETGMPAASSGIMLSLAYGGDTRVMARGTFLTTLLSIITIPIVALIVI